VPQAPTTLAGFARLGRFVPMLAGEWDVDAPGRAWQEIDSTLCFVDLSGFTQLSERLARRGRIGAEELTDVLNRVFGEMLEIAYARGGSLLKFGGDALLLHFVGNDHTVHATCAAVEMRSALRQAARHRTSVGRVPLRMSVGVHSGTVLLFRVGDSHSELVVAGPAATRVALMESTAEAGEILVSSETAHRLPADAIGAPKGDGFLVRWRSGRIPVTGPRPRRHGASESLAGSLPTALRNFLLHGVTEPEHRVATVAFVKFEGIDELLASAGVASTADALHTLLSTVQGAVDRAGVTLLATDVDKNGGKVILVTGVPATQSDDDGRMLRAVREIVDVDLPLRLRAGVHRGHVFAGEVGSRYRATFTIIGDTVNLAARLMAAAPSGGLLASPDVLERSRTLYATEALTPFRVKGKAQPVQAYAVGREIGSRTRRLTDVLPFVGRDAEMRVVLDAAAAAGRGSGSFLIIEGDAGVGKSRLIDEALASLAAPMIFRCHGEQAGSTSPYRALRDPVRALLGIPRTEPATMAKQLREFVQVRSPHLLTLLPLLGDVAQIDVPPTARVDSIELRFRPERTADAFAELLDVAFPGPIVFVFEDAQWMDSASTSLLRRLCSVIHLRPWACVIAQRSDGNDADPEDAPRLVLGPLAPAAAKAAVIAATAAAPLRPHEIDVLVSRAAGNPLFLGELLSIVHAGSVEDLPASLDAVVNAEIDALGVLPRRLVRYASVLGRSFRVDVLNELLADEHIELDDATRRQLGRFIEYDGSDRLRFRQEMHREVAYQGLTYRRRRELHLRAGRITERMAGGAPETVADLLAMHYSLAQQHRLAWDWSRTAGDRARQRYANVEAATHYRRAIDAARRCDGLASGELLDVWRTLGDVYEQLGMFEDAIDAYRRAAVLATDDHVARADLLWRRSRARMRLGSYRVALGEARRGLTLLADRDDVESRSWRARLIALQALLRQAQQRAAPAAALAQQAISAASAAGDDTALARAYLVSDWANHMLGVNGARTDARSHGELALQLYERLGDLDGVAKASNNLGGVCYFEGKWDDAVNWYRRALDAYRRAGNEVAAAVTASNLGELLVSRGSLDEAEVMLRDGIRVLRASRDLDGVLFAEIQLGRLLLARGDADAAAAHLDAIRGEAAALGQVGHVFEAATHLASALVELGQPEVALRRLDEALGEIGSVDPVFQATWSRVRAEALAGCGQTAQARAAIEHGLAAARDQGLSYDEGLLLVTSVEIERAQGVEPDPAVLTEIDALFARLNVKRPGTPATPDSSEQVGAEGSAVESLE
jgi:class 3 adenylate cyclase/tetratricopeptide (TPR) repeat protein